MIDTSKVIHAPVGGGRYTVTAPIVKEDYGLYLLIEGLELPSTYEVDFSNSENSGTSVTMIGNSDGVLIPHQFIDSGKDIFAFLYHVGDNYGRTVFKFRIPNKLRPDRTDEQPTPEEQSTIDQAISALNTAVEQTAQDVIDADASAQSASADADRAEEAKTDAQNFATQAEQSATDAQTSASQASASATASANSASQSAQIKTDVQGMVSDAQGYAQSASQSATASANSASQASASATSASQSATSASGYASQAQTSAQTATTKASEASTSAQTASQKATEASQSASQALTYKTDAESAKTASQTAQGLAESARDSAQGYAEDAQGYAEDAQASAESISASASQIAQNTADILKAFPTDTASGSVASFSDGADGIPLKSLIVNIDPVQDTSSGDPSPENICPISGWTGCEVNATGYNVWDEEWESGGLGYGNPASNASRIRSKNYIVCKPNTTYYFIRGANNGNMRVFFYDRNKVCLNPTVNGNNVSNSAVTTPDKCYYIRFFLSGQMKYQHDIAINYPSIDHDYHPYQGQTIPINWQTEAGTVYGGTLDVLTGKLTVYPYYASYNGETLTGRWISDRDVYAVGTTPTIGAQVVNIGAEGTEIQLSPTEVKSLYGQNNIFADTGDTEVVYRADTKLFIERLTAPDSEDMIADSNITSGQYFMVGNNLYKATANIASGASVIVGTNAIRKSLAQALNEINA